MANISKFKTTAKKRGLFMLRVMFMESQERSPMRFTLYLKIVAI
jgi:hypothetical protein